MTDLSERLDGPPLVAFWGTDDAGSPFRLGTREYDWHQHARGQLFCIESGLVHIRTAGGSWLLPAHRAGWIPTGIEHKASVSGVLSGWGVMITPRASAGLPQVPCVFGVSDLLRSLVRRATNWSAQEMLLPHQRRILAVLLDEIRLARQEPLHLPMPTDRRLVRIASALIDDPAGGKTLGELAGDAGISERSARRLFNAETGLSFADWRQQARLVLALERLAARTPVADIADALGYATASNFIAMFRKAFGTSPSRYFSGQRR